MASSPPPIFADGGFVSLLEGSGSLPTFPASSPVQNGAHASFIYDPAAPSPSWSFGKTPNPRGRMQMQTGDFLMGSPVNALRTTISSAALSSGSPLSYRRPSDNDADDVEVADHSKPPAWTDSHLSQGMAGQGLGFDGMENEFANLDSPMKAVSESFVPRTPSRKLTFAPQTPTPTANYPLSAPATMPSTVRRGHRSLSGLGTPSILRTGGRLRQATYNVGSVPPSPVGPRRRTESATSLTTSAPLTRHVSTGSFLDAASFDQSRVVSGASVMTASTSFELQSPNIGPYHGFDMGMHASQSMPGMLPSHHPSPHPSLAPSPTCATPLEGAVFYTSPATEQGTFELPQGQYTALAGQQSEMGDMSLMSGVNQVMGIDPVPQSASMASVSSFPGNNGYRQQTLDTIIETPVLDQDGQLVPNYQGYQQNMVPQQPELPSQSHFQSVNFPAVPNVHYQAGPSMAQQNQPAQPVDVGAWSQDTYQHSAHRPFGMSAQPVGHPFPPGYRNFSVSFPGEIQQQQHQQNAFGPHRMFARSISDSYTHMAPSMTHAHNMNPSLSSGGLFGRPAPRESGMDPMSSHQPLSGVPSSVPTSPDTPRKRKSHPRIGNHLRPGPKPKTPKRARTASSSQIRSSPPVLTDDSAGPSVPKRSRAQSPSRRLDFGGDLEAHLREQNTAGSGLVAPPIVPPQPLLVIDAPRGGELPSSGLSRTFIETLYRSVMVQDGPGPPTKKFQCLIAECERFFPRKSAIHSHIQTHLEDKPFECEVEGCNAAFVRQHDLRRHTRIHSGTKPFPCPCGKGFARGDALQRHRQRGICDGSTVPRRDPRSPARFNPY